MNFDTVLYERKGAITTISLNRPDVLNAQNRQLIRDTRAAFELAGTDDSARVVIFRGEGRAFCSGDDLSEDYSDVTTTEGRIHTIERLQDVTRVIAGIAKPVIASIQGTALGAGCEWAMNCDIRIAAEGAKFGFPEARWGFSVTNAGTKLLPALIGIGRAKELVYSTEKISAEQAERWGLVNHVVPEDELEVRTLELAEKIAAQNPLSIFLAKRALDRGPDSTIEEALSYETRDAVLCAENAISADAVAKAFEADQKSRRGK